MASQALIKDFEDMAAALQYIVDVCANKAPAELLADEPGTEQGPLGPNKVPTRVKRVIAAPQMGEADYATLAAACEEKGFLCIREGLRNYLAGIDVGVSTAELGIAASGTCMLNTDSEDVRLTGMRIKITRHSNRLNRSSSLMASCCEH